MDVTHIVIAEYSETGRFRTDAIYQYNYGQVLQLENFENLPSTFEVHFSPSINGKAITMIGNDGVVDIPDEFIAQRQPIFAWLFLHDEANDGETVFTIEIPIISRAAVSNREPTPVEKDAISEAIGALNNAVERTEAAAEGVEEAKDAAADSALKAEGYSVGKQNGQDVDQDSPYYEANAKYYSERAGESAQGVARSAEAAAQSARDASDSADDAAEDALKSEGYAVGKQNGVDVAAGSPYFENNAAYFANASRQIYNYLHEHYDEIADDIAGLKDGSLIPTADVTDIINNYEGE